MGGNPRYGGRTGGVIMDSARVRVLQFCFGAWSIVYPLKPFLVFVL